jgi:metallo-beta-lactamase family protein
MAIEATKLYARHRDLFDADAARLLAPGQLRRDLAGLRFTATAAESMALNESWDMAVIIAGSGMCDGGRILHHLKHNLWRHGVAVVIVGYQVRGSLGEQLIHGAREVRIFGEKIVVRASVHTLGGFSAHAGRRELVEWAGHLTPDRPRVVLTHGEPEARDALKAALLAEHGVEAECPGPGATIELA